jgi:membrane protein DedA with SNARE-associated domain
MRSLQLAIVLLIIPLLTLRGQSSSPVPLVVSIPSSEYGLNRSSEDSRLSLPVRASSHWAEGGAIGAVILGSLAAVVSSGLCSYSDGNQSCGGAALGGAFVGAAVGFTIGSLIGARFPKH